MKIFWDSRYKEEEYVYGKAPNEYFKQVLDTITPGKILLPAEGEGRNAVYAASLGWEVYAYDFSEFAYKKAISLAQENKVVISYQIASLDELTFTKGFFDVIGLIYVHFPDPLRTKNHRHISAMLKKEGTIILEAFSTHHPEYQKINPKIGGPKMPFQLYDKTKLETDFNTFEFLTLEEKEVTLNEGKYHKGKAMVMRMRAKKK